MTIRRVRPEDAAAITAMIHALAEFENAAEQCTVTEKQITAALFGDTPAVHGHVADVGGEVAAMALWFLNFSTWDGVAGIYLEDLFVRPEFRRRGLARALDTWAGPDWPPHEQQRIATMIATGNARRVYRLDQMATTTFGTGP